MLKILRDIFHNESLNLDCFIISRQHFSASSSTLFLFRFGILLLLLLCQKTEKYFVKSWASSRNFQQWNFRPWKFRPWKFRQ